MYSVGLAPGPSGDLLQCHRILAVTRTMAGGPLVRQRQDHRSSGMGEQGRGERRRVVEVLDGLEARHYVTLW